MKAKKNLKKTNPKEVGHFLAQILLPAARWICVWWPHFLFFLFDQMANGLEIVLESFRKIRKLVPKLSEIPSGK